MRNHSLLKIAFTSPLPVADEPQRIAMLLDQGWDIVHLRHPGVDRDTLERVLVALPAEMMPRIVLHDHFDLSGHYPVGALHLNSRNPVKPAGYTGSVTASCHSIEEAIGRTGMRYVTLSPVFDSISKPGYLSGFTPADFAGLHRASCPVIALGGVMPGNIARVNDYGFAGYAVMGALAWHDNINSFHNSLKCFNS